MRFSLSFILNIMKRWYKAPRAILMVHLAQVEPYWPER